MRPAPGGQDDIRRERGQFLRGSASVIGIACGPAVVDLDVPPSLGASPDLQSAIRTVLDRSRYFILLASPEVAASTWVNWEVQYWLERRGLDSLLILLTRGSLEWNPQTHEFREGPDITLPDALRGAFPAEPLWLDLRKFGTGGDSIDLRHPAFRNAVARIAAIIHGVPVDEMVRRELREGRRGLSVVGAAAAAILVLGIGIGFFLMRVM